MNWSLFPYFSLTALLLWAASAITAWRGARKWTFILSTAGLAVMSAFILGMWISLERPPLRTMGETRLWYAFFLPLVGTVVYGRWKYRWILTFSTMLACVFTLVNLLKPEIHDKTLMPALQSPWFAPHVIVYMFAYAMFGAVTVMALFLLFKRKVDNMPAMMSQCDDLVRTGLSFLTIGMLFGAFWANRAWGAYWTWDPKETWAAITWLSYFLYIHLRKQGVKPKATLAVLLVSFVFLQLCWWGINYLPSAQGMSAHTY